MIKITATLAGNTDITKFITNLRKNIHRGRGVIANKLTTFTHKTVKAKAPRWKGTLKKNVIKKVFMKKARGEVMMRDAQSNMIALENEFNLGGRRVLYKGIFRSAAEWADSKGLFTGQPFVIVGGINTRFGRQNMFFQPSFQSLIQTAPKLTTDEISKILHKTRG